MSYSVDTTVTRLVTLNNALSSLPSLYPSGVVNQHFSALVETVSPRHHLESHILNMPVISDLSHSFRDVSAKGEYEMELYWAQQIICHTTPDISWRTLRSFWYYQNYERLLSFELGLLKKSGFVFSSDTRIAFVGGGPLPLSAILLANIYGTHVTVIDNDKVASDTARAVVDALGLSHLVTILHISGETYDGYHDFDTIFVASLAGVEVDTKKHILSHIGLHMQHAARVVVRSATGLRVLLYPSVCMHCVDSLRVVVHEDPEGELINCAYICVKGV